MSGGGFSAALAVEWRKAVRSRVPWGVSIGFSFAPLVAGLFMVILKDPETARKIGLLGTKAQLTAGTADWPTMLGMLSQAIAIGGGVLIALLTAWVFGREFSDRTLRTLLATPTSRSAIVAAKTAVILGWGAVTAAWVIALGFAVGAAVGLPGWSSSLAGDALGRMAGAAVLTLALQTPTAFFAGLGRGYLAPMGWAFAMVVAAQVTAVLGLGAGFPWAVPALVSGAAGPDATVTAWSYGLVLVTAVAGFAATVAWWRLADHTG